MWKFLGNKFFNSERPVPAAKLLPSIPIPLETVFQNKSDESKLELTILAQE